MMTPKESWADALAKTRDENAKLATGNASTYRDYNLIAGNDHLVALLGRMSGEENPANNGVAIEKSGADALIGDMRELAKNEPELADSLNAMADLMDNWKRGSRMSSADETLARIKKIFQDGIRDGSIRFSPPGPGYMAALKEKTEQQQQQQQPQQPSQPPKQPLEEQNSESFVVAPNTWATMTVEERRECLKRLLKTGKNLTLNGVPFVFESNPGPISMSFGGLAKENLDLIESRAMTGATREEQRMSNDTQDEQTSPERKAFWERLKKLSIEGHPSATGRFVEGGPIGPITIFSTPSFEKPRSEPPPDETETAMDGGPQPASASTDSSNDASQPAPLSKEQLRSLLNDFLDQLTAKPPAPASADWQQPPTPGELYRAWQQGGAANLMEMLPDEPDGEDE
jgi:hypothetical protein